MRRILATVALLAAGAVAFQTAWLPLWGAIVAVLAVGAVAWRLSVCPHAGPLALLPATTALDGTALPPRWFCDACGRTWTANFSKTQTPRPSFTGYDESKAVASAKRAAELTERQRSMALKRAGLKPTKKLEPKDNVTVFKKAGRS